MPEEGREDRTEPATRKRREETRERGSVPYSAEVDSVFVLLFGVVAVYACGSLMAGHLGVMMRRFFSGYPAMEITAESLGRDVTRLCLEVAAVLAPVVLVLLAASFAASYAQFGFLWTWHPLRPRLTVIRPRLSRINLFSRDKIVDLLVSLAKIAIIGLVAFWSIRRELGRLVPLMEQDVVHIGGYLVKTAFRLVLTITAVLVVLAVLDFAYHKWRHEESMKMTRQQVQDERKNLEGDPLVRSRVRAAHVEMARQRMMKELPRADVVITDPLHCAVAILYDPEIMPAPKVVAKGAPLLAERIIEIARQHGIPVVESRPLAQALYRAVEVGCCIPVAFYHAVAEVLASIYRLKGRAMPRPVRA